MNSVALISIRTIIGLACSSLRGSYEIHDFVPLTGSGPASCEGVGLGKPRFGGGSLQPGREVNRMFFGGLLTGFFWFLALALGRAGW